MPVVLVRASHHIGHLGHGAIGDHRTAETDRAERTGTGAKCRPDRLGAGENQRRLDLWQLFGLDRIHLVVAAHQQQYRLPVLTLDHHRFHRPLSGNFQEVTQFGNGLDTRRMHARQGFGWRQALAGWSQRFGQLDVGGVVATVGKGDGILTGFGQHMKFVECAPPMLPVSANTARNRSPNRVKMRE